MKLELQRDGQVPLYRQIANEIRSLIERGVLGPGARLPTVRRLSDEHELGRLTVQTAYSELQAQGFIESVVGRGTFVSERPQPGTLPSAIAPRVGGSLAELLDRLPTRLLLGQATPAEETFPVRELKTCFGRALQQPSNMAYGPVLGEESLRIQMSRILLGRGLAAAPESILITSGAQQGIDLAVRTLTTPDRPVVIEAPVYPGVLELLRSRRQRWLEVPMGEEGLNLEVLEELCRDHRPPLVYTIATYHNPTGVATSQAHRRALLELAEKYDFLILEDDVYGTLALDGRAPVCLKAMDHHDRVIYLTGFSKSLMPALRLGAMVASPGRLAALTQLRGATDLISSSLMQVTLAEFLEAGYYEAHLQKVCELYRQRRDASGEALSELLPDCACRLPQGGLSLWLELPADIDEGELFRQAREHGVMVARGQAFFGTPAPAGFLRLTFATLGKPLFRQGVAVLAQLIEAQRRGRLQGDPLV